MLDRVREILERNGCYARARLIEAHVHVRNVRRAGHTIPAGTDVRMSRRDRRRRCAVPNALEAPEFDGRDPIGLQGCRHRFRPRSQDLGNVSMCDLRQHVSAQAVRLPMRCRRPGRPDAARFRPRS